MRRLSPRERKLIAVAILVVLIALVQLFVIQPVIDGFASRAAEREELAARYARNQRLIGSIERLKRDLLRERASLAGYSLAARDQRDAVDLLRQRIQRATERLGGEFRGAEDVEGRERWVGTRAVLRVSLPQLAALLADLQNTPPYLIVETLHIDAKEPIAGQPSPPLEVSLEIDVPVTAAAPR